jgi:oligoendopeptidase F
MADRLPLRSEVPVEHTWDLTRLFASDAEWETAFAEFEALVGGFARFRGTLASGPAALAECLRYDTQVDRLGDRVGTYAFLKASEDVANSTYNGMKARYIGAAGKAAEAASFIRPEIMAIPDEQVKGYLTAPAMADYRLVLERVLRYKPHTLTDKEERLLAMQVETSQTPRQVFDQLNNADLKFGRIAVDGKEIDLTHGTFAKCLEHPDRDVRKTAFHQYYAAFVDHANTLAAAFAGSVKQDVYYSRVRNYASARAASLFPDNVPEAVYDNLVSAVRSHLPAVHKYYALRKRAMKLPDIHFYDVYLPVLSDIRKVTPWDTAVELCIKALKPLGIEYGDQLAKGLRGRWCDRYENKGKRSGAFSSGCYDSDPYILMNYQDDVLDHVFTLAHEAGHSMHSYLSHKSQPYQYANYTIFVAEVASTFNEQLLGRYMKERAADDRERAYYLNREIDEIRKTVVRQTMFAEFEAVVHGMAERNEPLTVDALRAEYRKLLDAYFGPDFVIDDELSLEGLRIPHFYGAFYVYKYATGLSAAVALAERVSNGGQAELDAYLNFLRGGCSKDPLDLLRAAGVDMEQPGPVAATLDRFSKLVDELDGLLQ